MQKYQLLLLVVTPILHFYILHFPYRKIKKTQLVDQANVVVYAIYDVSRNALSFCATIAKHCTQNRPVARAVLRAATGNAI
jgi:hypothetical protein